MKRPTGSSMAADDASAVLRCLKGDSEAFEILVTRYRALAVSVAFSICRERAQAEDVAQEAFVRAYRKLRQLTRHESFCAWLLHIVRNAALRAAHNVARREEAQRLIPRAGEPHIENPAAAMEFAEILAQVDEDAQQILNLRYLHGLTCAEVGQTLRLPVGTVTSKICRALATLRAKLKRERQ